MNRKALGAFALTSGVLLPAAALANVSSTLESINALSDRAGYQVNDVILTSELQRRVQSNSAVQQAYYALLSELTDSDNDNTQEASAMRASLSGYTPPTGGGFVPNGSVAAKIDGYGMPLGYCAWDHGTDNTSTDRISGSTTASNSDISLAVLSSGVDRAFSTSCADAASGTVNGDDLVTLVTLGQGSYGVATNQHFGKPVATRADLAALDTSNTEAGELRMVLETGKAYGWLDLDGDGTYQWEAVSSHFYSGDSNGLAAGGEYTTSPFDVGIGAKFSDRSVLPQSALEVDGQVRIVNGTGVVDTDGNAQLHIGSQEAASGTWGEVYRLAIQPYTHAGGPFNFVARDLAGRAFLDIRYGNRPSNESIVSFEDDGHIGLGSDDPTARLHVKYLTGNAGDYLLDLDEERPSDGPAHHKALAISGNGKQLSEIGALSSFSSGTPDLDYFFITTNQADIVAGTGHKAPDFVIDDTGNIGLGTVSPEARLHLASEQSGKVGDAVFLIEADADNNNEEDNPGIRMFQDARKVEGYIGMNNNAQTYYQDALTNAFYMESADDSASQIQFVTGRAPSDPLSKGVARMTIREDGKVGIGTNAPASALDIDGKVTSGPILIDQGDTSGSAEGYVTIDRLANLGDEVGVLIRMDGDGDLNSDGLFSLGQDDIAIELQSAVNPATDPVLTRFRLWSDGDLWTEGDMTTEGSLTLGDGKGIEWNDNIWGGTGDDAWIRYIQDGAGEDTALQIGIDNDANDHLSFYQGGAERMVVRNGNVGIGTGNPVAMLQIGQSAMTGAPGGVIEEHQMRFGTQTHTGAGFDIWQRDQPDQAYLDFYYAGQGKHLMTFVGTGKVGIGTKSPQKDLHISGETRIDGSLDLNGALSLTNYEITWSENTDSAAIGFHNTGDGNASYMYFKTRDNKTEYFRWIHDSTTDSGVDWMRLKSSNLWIRGSLTQNSDARLKKDIETIGSGLDTVNKMRGVSYYWKKDASTDRALQHGFIAQELLHSLPDAVVKNMDGYYAVKYDQVTPVLVEAVKELDDKVEDVIKKTDEHDIKLREYETKLKTYEQRIVELEKKQDNVNDKVLPEKNNEDMKAQTSGKISKEVRVQRHNVPDTTPMAKFYRSG